MSDQQCVCVCICQRYQLRGVTVWPVIVTAQKCVCVCVCLSILVCLYTAQVLTEEKPVKTVQTAEWSGLRAVLTVALKENGESVRMEQLRQRCAV